MKKYTVSFRAFDEPNEDNSIIEHVHHFDSFDEARLAAVNWLDKIPLQWDEGPKDPHVIRRELSFIERESSR